MNNEPLYFPKDFKKDKNGIWIQNKHNLDHNSKEGDTPICLRKTDKLRLFDSLDFSSLLRFWIATNWMKDQFVSTKKSVKKPRILDLGCANLQAYHIWHNNGNYFGWPSVEYYGVDVNYKRLMVGKELFKFKRSDTITLIQANLEHPIIFINDQSLIKRFDFIVCMEFLEHIPKECFEMIMNNIKKKQLKKLGTAILSSPNPNKEGGEEVVWKKMSPVSHIYERSYQEAKELIEKAGLKILDKASTLARGNYRAIANKECKSVRKELIKFLPASVTNNILCLADEVMCGRQWIIRVGR